MQRLRQMLPRLPLNDKQDSTLTDTKHLSESIKGNNSGAVHGPDFNDLPLVQLCGASIRSALSIQPSLPHAVAHIVQVGSEKQMSRIAAPAIIATMATFKSVWNWAVGVLPRKSVCHFRSWFYSVSISPFWVWSKPTVAVIRLISKPRPAFVWTSFLNLSPKSNLGWGFSNHVCGELNT